MLLLLYGLLHLSSVQTWLVKKVAGRLSRDLHTEVSIKRIDIGFFDKIALEGLLIRDQKKDTLLYAGEARAKVTDWFFLKDEATFTYISLDDALVNLKRSDSVWNHQFLIDYFSSPSTGKKKSGGIAFDFREIHVNRLRFNQLDGWGGRDLRASLTGMDVFIDSVNLDAQKAFVRSVRLVDPAFMQSDYTGAEPEDSTATTPAENSDARPPRSKDGWQFRLGNLDMVNGSVMILKDMESDPIKGVFEGGHLFFSRINGKVRQVSLTGDSLAAHIDLSAMERSGLEVKRLSADAQVTPEKMAFMNLDLQTNRSRLKNYFAMNYQSFNRDMNDFIHRVKMEADFTDATLSSDDLAFFAPNLASWKKAFRFTGKAKGTVDNFATEHLSVSSQGTSFEGEVSMRGLPDINSTFINIKSDGLKTRYTDLVVMVPSLKQVKQPPLSQLGNIYYKGNFTGFINDFVAFGSIRTDMGLVTADINMKIPEKGVPSYSGKILTRDFQLGKLLGNNLLGSLSLNGRIKGSGFNLKDLDAAFDGQVPEITFNGYRYRNLNLDGTFRSRKFYGHLNIDDPNLGIKDLVGGIDLSGREIAFNLSANLQQANLKEIGLTKDDFRLNGLFSLNFTGNNIDEFLGTARITEANLSHRGRDLQFDSLLLQSEKTEKGKLLTLSSSQFDATLDGHFKILDLPAAFNVFLNKYYPSYISKPGSWVGSQDFRFKIRTKEISDYITLLDPRMSGLNDAEISGNLDLANNELNLSVAAPEFIFDGKIFSDIRLTGKGNRDTLRADIALSDIRISDSLNFPETRLSLTASNDITQFSLKTSAGKTLNDAELNASVQTMRDGIKVHFYPSYFTINDKKWLLEKDGELVLRKKFIDANEVIFRHNDEQIKLYTELDELTDHTHIVAKLEKVSIGDFTPFFLQNPSLKGILTGTAMVREPFGKTYLDFRGSADSFSMDEKYIGKIDLSATANTGNGMVRFNAESREKEYDFSINGHYNYLDSTGNRLGINLNGGRINLNILEPYLGTIFSKMDGEAEANLNIEGSGDDTWLTGLVKIKNASLLVGYTQCRYLLENEAVKFEKNKIDLGKMRIKDTLGNTASVSGVIGHRFFDDMSFNNIRMETGKLLLLNTTKKDNSQFYGNVIGSAKMNINGPLTDMVMNIEGKPSYVDSSHIYLPTGSEKESDVIDYIDFVEFGSLMGAEQKTGKGSNILVNLALTATPACKVDVILDEQTGDIIKGNGEGQINIKVGTREPLSIRGLYELKKGGEYTFNFQTFFKRQFLLNRGTISFNGNPYDAMLDLYAEYEAERVDISNLSPTGGFRQKETVTIVSHLTGSLKQPMIDFEFRLPPNSEAGRNDIIVKKLADFRNDKNELNKQVASLLLFNSFLIGEQNPLSGGSGITSFATNTIGGIISGWLTNIFNKELEKATKGLLSTYIDINPTLDLQRNAQQLQANVRAGLKLFLDKRLLLLVGGNLDYNNPNFSQQISRRGLFTPDISLEYLLTKDGSFRVVGFNRTSVDYTLNQLNRSGLQLSYRKEVNRISDIFRRTKKKVKQEPEADKTP